MNIDELKDRIARAEEIQRYTENRCKALEKENAELKEKVKHRNCLDCSNHSSKLRMRTLELEKENAELKEKLNIRSCQNCKHKNKSCPNDGSCKNYSKWEGYENPQLTNAKEII